MTSSHEGSASADRESEHHEGVKITDKRRLDPVTGQLRPPVESAGADEVLVEVTGADDADLLIDPLAQQLAERLDDLQRLQAEFTNYRRRVERDRDVARDQAIASTLAELLPVLDDIGRARVHGELEGGFRSVGEALETVVSRLGLKAYGTPGDVFDPTIHEAISHDTSPDVTESSCAEIYQPGYRYGERVIRAAVVSVVDPQ